MHTKFDQSELDVVLTVDASWFNLLKYYIYLLKSIFECVGIVNALQIYTSEIYE